MNLKRLKTLSTILILIIAFLFLQMQVFAVEGVQQRDKIEDKYKWKLEDIYSGIDSWNSDFKKIQDEYITSIEKFKSNLGSSAKVLDCFKLMENAYMLIDKVYVYAQLKSDENQADNTYSEMLSKTDSLYSQFQASLAFIQPELIELPESVLNSYISSSSLADYRPYFETIIKLKSHTLSQGEEELLAMTGDLAGAPQDIYTKLKNADTTFPKIINANGKEVQLSEGMFSSILNNPDREYRKRGFEGIYSIFKKSINTFASTLNAEVKKNIFYARAKKYDSALEASLSGEDIPKSVFDNLLDSVNKNTTYLHKYVELRKKALGVDKVHLYDMYVPLVGNYTQTINYEDAQKMILDGLKPLGDDYLNTLRKGFSSRWIDVYETENKATGGYQIGIYGTHPYVLLNFNDTTDDMLTLAHEMGHALNSYYTNQTQKYINSNIPIFTAEIASTTNEILMLKYLINHSANDDEKLYYLNKLIEEIRGSVFTQVMYSEFEKAIHERVESGEALSAKTFNEIWKNLMQKYYGENFEVDELAQLWWARIPHFYMNFYVYKYATSMSASYEISKNLSEGKNVDNYLAFLKSGSVYTPIDSIKMVGVDMNTPQAIDDLLKEFGSLVDQMQTILEKKKGANNSESQTSTIKVKVNGKEIALPQAPKLVGNKIDADLEALSKALGAKIVWNKDKSSCSVSKNGKTVVLTLNSSEIFANGGKIDLDTAVFNENGSTLVPVRFLTETFNGKVTWDEKYNTVIIKIQ